MAKSTAKVRIHPVTFNEYKSIAEDLENRLKPRFQILETKIGALDKKFEVKFELLDNKIDLLKSEIRTIKCLIPLVITLIMGIFTVPLKLIIK